jgi:hypothetical protein
VGLLALIAPTEQSITAGDSIVCLKKGVRSRPATSLATR